MEEIFDKVTGVMGKLRTYAFSLTGERESADDLLQESLLRIMVKADRYRAIGSFEAWAKRVMLNIFLREIERRTRAMEALPRGFITGHEEARWAELREPVFSAGCDSYCHAREIKSIIRCLPRLQYDVVVLRISGYSYIEIAETLGTTIGNVKNAIHNARENIRKMMEE